MSQLFSESLIRSSVVVFFFVKCTEGQQAWPAQSHIPSLCVCSVVLLSPHRRFRFILKKHPKSSEGVGMWMPNWSFVLKNLFKNPNLTPLLPHCKRGTVLFSHESVWCSPAFSSACRVHISQSYFYSATVHAAPVGVSSVTSRWLYFPPRLRSAAVCSPAASSERWCPPPAPWWSDEMKETLWRRRERWMSQKRKIL